MAMNPKMKHKICTAFGKEIRRRRKVRELLQSELASQTGLTATYIGMLERGEVNPAISSVYKISRALEVSPGELIESFMEPSPSALETARLFDTLAPETQKSILSLLRGIRDCVPERFEPPSGHKPGGDPNRPREPS